MGNDICTRFTPAGDSLPTHPYVPHSAADDRTNIPLFDPTSGRQDGLANLGQKMASMGSKTDKQGGDSMVDTPLSEDEKDLTKVSTLHQQGPFNPAALVATSVAKKILNLQFVEIADIALDEPLPSTSKHSTYRPPVRNISRWIEKYAIMAALLCARFPEKGPELFAYLQTIVAAERDYETDQWLVYDRLYRRQALSQKSLDWSVIDSRLYQSSFTGRARTIVRCPDCLEGHDKSEPCRLQPQPLVVAWPQPAWQSQPYAYQPTQPVFNPTQALQHPEPCRRYNKGLCKSGSKCKYQHVCSACGGRHPASHCSTPRTGPIRPMMGPRPQTPYFRP